MGIVWFVNELTCLSFKVIGFPSFFKAEAQSIELAPISLILTEELNIYSNNQSLVNFLKINNILITKPSWRKSIKIATLDRINLILQQKAKNKLSTNFWHIYSHLKDNRKTTPSYERKFFFDIKRTY